MFQMIQFYCQMCARNFIQSILEQGEPSFLSVGVRVSWKVGFYKGFHFLK